MKHAKCLRDCRASGNFGLARRRTQKASSMGRWRASIHYADAPAKSSRRHALLRSALSGTCKLRRRCCSQHRGLCRHQRQLSGQGGIWRLIACRVAARKSRVRSGPHPAGGPRFRSACCSRILASDLGIGRLRLHRARRDQLEPGGDVPRSPAAADRSDPHSHPRASRWRRAGPGFEHLQPHDGLTVWTAPQRSAATRVDAHMAPARSVTARRGATHQP
jgi:hypothetical protein